MLSSSKKIAIIGVGQVGGAAAYALVLSSIASELLLVDSDRKLRDGQVQDLCDVSYSTDSGTRVRAASYREAAECDIIIITAGSKQTMGQTTLDYTSQNICIVRDVINAMMPFRSDAILIIVAHPVDLITSIAQKMSKLPPSQVFGSGTLVESMRLRGILAERTGVAAQTIDVQVLGVHGYNQVIAWSTAKISGIPIASLLPFKTKASLEEIQEESTIRLESIISAKGASPFGIGSIVCSLCSAILLDKGSVRTVSQYQPAFGCYLSFPAEIARKGVVRKCPVALSQDEEVRLIESAQDLAKSVDWARREFL